MGHNLAADFWEAMRHGDPRTASLLFSADAVLRFGESGGAGNDQVERILQDRAKRFPKIELVDFTAHETEDGEIATWRASFFNRLGQQFTVSGADIVQAEGGRITSLISHYDPGLLHSRPLVQQAIETRFLGARVLVTGAGSGIGAATALQFLAEGAHVTGVDLNPEGLAAQVERFGALAERFTPIVADIADREGQAEVISRASGPDGALDVIVNNAAVFLLAGVDATDEDWRRTVDVNLIAPAQLTATARVPLSRSRFRAVINIASISGHRSQAGRWTYNAAKGGVISLTRCQALDLAPLGIRVNSVSPGYIWTEVLDRGADGDRAKWEPIWGSFCPQRRCAEPFEVAQAIAFLASPAASFITGNDLLVDGGLASMSPDGQALYEFSS